MLWPPHTRLTSGAVEVFGQWSSISRLLGALGSTCRGNNSQCLSRLAHSTTASLSWGCAGEPTSRGPKETMLSSPLLTISQRSRLRQSLRSSFGVLRRFCENMGSKDSNTRLNTLCQFYLLGLRHPAYIRQDCLGRFSAADLVTFHNVADTKVCRSTPLLTAHT